MVERGEGTFFKETVNNEPALKTDMKNPQR